MRLSKRKRNLVFNFSFKNFRVITILPSNNWALVLTVAVGPLLLGFT